MKYLNNQLKFVCIFNRRFEIGNLINAGLHLAMGISTQLDENALSIQHYTNKDIELDSMVSEYPWIALKAKNSNQLKTVHNIALCEGIVHNPFLTTMVRPSSEEQVNATYESDEGNIEYMAIALFGKAEKLDPHTKKFSLFT